MSGWANVVRALLLGALLLHAIGSSEARRSPATQQAEPAYFLEVLTARPTILQDITAEEQAIVDQHFQYLQGLFKEGKVVMVGRRTDVPFGMVVLQAASLEEAQGWAAADPSVRAGIMKAEVYPFRIAMLRGERR